MMIRPARFFFCDGFKLAVALRLGDFVDHVEGLNVGPGARAVRVNLRDGCQPQINVDHFP